MISSSKRFIKIQVGDEVADGEKSYRVTHLISGSKLLAVNLENDRKETLSIGPLQLVKTTSGSPEKKADRDLESVTREEQAKIDYRMSVLKEVYALPQVSLEAIGKIARANGTSPASIYRWKRLYEQSGHASALIPEKSGRKWGSLQIDDDVERIMQSVIEENYLHKQRPTVQAVINELLYRCRLAHVVPPHPNTLRNRINRISEEMRLKRRGQGELARNLFNPIKGKFPGANYPFDVVQIDHTVVDIITVDEEYRRPIGRPHITLATDVFSRMVVGFYLSYDRPDATSVGICLAQAMCPKEAVLAKMGVKGDWPVWGQIGTVHCDNAKEFRSGALQRGCEEYSINLAFRPPKRPAYGGNVESLMKRLANEVHTYPGTTFSNPKDRKGYDSEAESALTLKELERNLANFFINIYHNKVHGELGTSPLSKWNVGILGDEDNPGLGVMPKPEDPGRILLDFLPGEMRSVQRYGVQLNLITYSDPILYPYINTSGSDGKGQKREFMFRYDPRDISRIYFFEPGLREYTPIPYVFRDKPPMSLADYKEVREWLKKRGNTLPNEHQIFEAFGEIRKTNREGVEKTKAARRQYERSAEAHKARNQPSSSPKNQGAGDSSSSAKESVYHLSPISVADSKQTINWSDSSPERFDIEDL